jgi:antitoxin MazE
MYIMEADVKVAKWGNSLAVRLPQPLVERLGLKEGDEVELSASSARGFEVSRDHRREEALDRIRAMRVPLPPDYKFDRQDANSRGGFKVDPDMTDDH